MAASCAETLRSAQAYSLLETAASRGWRAGVALERALADRAPVLGVSLALNHPRLGGAARATPSTRRHSTGSRAPPCARSTGPPAGAARARAAFAEGGAQRRSGVRRPAVRRPRRGAAPGDRGAGGVPPRAGSTRSSCPSLRRRPPSRASHRTRCRRRISRSGSRCASGGTTSRSWTAAPSCSSTASSAGSPTRRRRRTAPSSPPRGRAATPTSSRRRSWRRAPTRARSRPTARAAPAIRCSPSRNGTPASPRSAASARCSWPGAVTRLPRASSASSRCTASRPRWRWATPAPATRASLGLLLSPPYFPLVVGGACNRRHSTQVTVCYLMRFSKAVGTARTGGIAACPVQGHAHPDRHEAPIPETASAAGAPARRARAEAIDGPFKRLTRRGVTQAEGRFIRPGGHNRVCPLNLVKEGARGGPWVPPRL